MWNRVILNAKIKIIDFIKITITMKFSAPLSSVYVIVSIYYKHYAFGQLVQTTTRHKFYLRFSFRVTSFSNVIFNNIGDYMFN